VVCYTAEMMRRFEGRVALVTGAGKGIGRATAARLLEEGAKVTFVEADRRAGEDAADELAVRGPVRLQVADVSDEAAVTEAVADTVRWAGALDVVVNNAAAFLGWQTPVEELPLADWRRMLDVNLTGTLLVCRAAIPHLRVRKGAIVNLTSTRAEMSEPNTEAYATTKGGLVALTHALAISLGPAIRVNAIAPGWIATDAWNPRYHRRQPELRAIDHDQHPVGRVGTPEDVAALAAYLASDEAGFITGQIFTIDGGMTRKMIYAE
jgi:NAD(P)-dependent dehydrogenase (short-subunit alcohol dehydrogenase family)